MVNKNKINPNELLKSGKGRLRLTLRDLAITLLLLLAATVIGFVFYRLKFSEANIITVYILSVLITAILTADKLYGAVSSVFSVVIFNFFFTTPRFTLNAYDSGYPVTFLIMFVSALITSTLAIRIKNHAKQAAELAYRTKILLDTNQLLQQAKQKSGIVSVTCNQLAKLLKKNIAFYGAENGAFCPPMMFMYENAAPSDKLSENEDAAASWVLEHNKRAGASTDVFESSKYLFLAVRVNDIVYGVLGIELFGDRLDTNEDSILLSILGECALALEKEKAVRDREEASVLAKNEQLRANLLRSISHDLRTPLTSISGNAAILLSDGDSFAGEKRRELYSDIYDDSLWLINLVENLLSVTRIEDGSMKLNLAAELLEEVVSEALHHINRKGAEHEISVVQAEDFILASCDARLIVQVIINIVDNAIKYTPNDSRIAIYIKKSDGMAVIEIADSGKGVPDEIKPKIFDMFYTINNNIADSRRSLGLGLALCKSIITAHGGEISVHDNEPSGAVFRFTLPATEVKLHE